MVNRNCSPFPDIVFFKLLSPRIGCNKSTPTTTFNLVTKQVVPKGLSNIFFFRPLCQQDQEVPVACSW